MSEFCVAEGITFRYFEKSARNILENASFTFKKGEVAVVIGNSGCGKSTLAAVMCGLYPENGGYLESGSVFIDGKEIKDMSYRERSTYIAEMFQNPDLQFCMSNLRDELRFCMENACVPMEEMDKRIVSFAEEYDINELLDIPFHNMSGGEKQKAALCCILLISPKVMVLDEPFANLDKVSREHFLALLNKKVKKGDTAIIAIDHLASNWSAVADRYIMLGDKGQIVSDKRTLGNHNYYGASSEKYCKKADTAGKEVFSFKDVSISHKKSKDILLSNVNISANEGQMIACLGPSGGGKTSLFLTLLRQKEYTGSIIFCGKELRHWKKRELYSKVGIVFQNPGNQFIASTVRDEVEKSLVTWRQNEKENISVKGKELLEYYDLTGYSKYSPYMLSQGQQRRLGVLTMLAGGQKLLLLDEPTYGQDMKTTMAIMNQMQERAENGLTVIFSTHDEKLAYKYADTIWKVGEGRVYEEH